MGLCVCSVPTACSPVRALPGRLTGCPSQRHWADAFLTRHESQRLCSSSLLGDPKATSSYEQSVPPVSEGTHRRTVPLRVLELFGSSVTREPLSPPSHGFACFFLFCSPELSSPAPYNSLLPNQTLRSRKGNAPTPDASERSSVCGHERCFRILAAALAKTLPVEVSQAKILILFRVLQAQVNVRNVYSENQLRHFNLISKISFMLLQELNRKLCWTVSLGGGVVLGWLF